MEDLDFGDVDALEGHVARHGVRLSDILEVKDDEPKLLRDRNSYLMVGCTEGGRLLAVRIRHRRGGLWSVGTAYDAPAEERSKYGRK